MNTADIDSDQPAVMVADALITHSFRHPGPQSLEGMATFIVDYLAQLGYEIAPLLSVPDTAAELIRETP